VDRRQLIMSNKIVKIESICISSKTRILDVLKKMDELDVKLLIVLEENIFRSVISIGDIQRALIRSLSLDMPIKNILRKEVEVALDFHDIEFVKKQMIATKTECMPVLDSGGRLVDVIFWEELFEENIDTQERINLPVVIMAGGKGTRLKPLTNLIPKPLIPIGNTTIIEEIIDMFNDYGCHDFHISVNYKSEMIMNHLDSDKRLNTNINYFQEEKPLGTCGSMYLLKKQIDTTFFLTNCDILINQDLAEVYSFHRKNRNEMTVIAALKHYPIPYGTIEVGDNASLVALKEKPELTFRINSGMYILEPHLLDYIPDNTFFHITELIEMIKAKGGRVGVFPISQGSWKDIGEWKGYLNYINK